MYTYKYILGPKIISELPQSLRIYNLAITPEFLKSAKYNKFPAISKLWNCHDRKEISRDLIRAITREASPEGIIAEIGTPEIKTERHRIPPNGRVLFLYNISDPGNLGALIRTAKAFGWNDIALVDDCVDPFNSECIRSSMGLSLKINIYRLTSNMLLDFSKENDLKLFIADKNAEKPSHSLGSRVHSKIGLFLGSEANGFARFPQDVRDLCVPISINISTEVESLNVAVCGGIIMKHLSDIMEENNS